MRAAFKTSPISPEDDRPVNIRPPLFLLAEAWPQNGTRRRDETLFEASCHPVATYEQVRIVKLSAYFSRLFKASGTGTMTADRCLSR